MSTVGALVDRLYRKYLEPPDFQPATSRLGLAMDDTQQTLSFAQFDVPEDDTLVRLGSIVEVEQELMRVTGFDVNTLDATVLRGQLGTQPAAHVVDSQVKLAPPFARIEAFEAIRENIVQLYPDLWTVRTEVLSPVRMSVYPIEDALAVEIVEGNPNGATNQKVNGRIVDNHPATDGRSIVCDPNSNYGVVWWRYRRRFGVATSEADTLESLGVEDAWTNVVLVGAAADLMVGRDLPQAQTQWVQSSLEAENIQVGTRLSLSGGLAQYRDILMDRFRKEMRAEDSNKVRVHTADPFSMV